MRSRGRTVSIIIKTILVLLVFFLIFLDSHLLLSRIYGKPMMPVIFGRSYAVVTSDSMEPELSPGDIVVIERAEYKRNDIITFYDDVDGIYITHRIISVGELGHYATKGDANPRQDNFGVTDGLIVGKVVDVREDIGKPILFMTSPIGVFSVITFVVIAWAILNKLQE